tara:strand:+ start:2851 stop:3147 length:297 start_codon:yes stop_codon:yes gene_type:complete
LRERKFIPFHISLVLNLSALLSNRNPSCNPENNVIKGDKIHSADHLFYVIAMDFSQQTNFEYFRTFNVTDPDTIFIAMKNLRKYPGPGGGGLASTVIQ